MLAGLLALLALSPAAAAVKNPDTFVYAVTGDVNSLDPQWQYDSLSHWASFLIYETLLEYKGASTEQLQPLLAAKVPSKENGLISQDGLTYRFPVRQGVRFHDGTPLAAEDFRYSVLRFMLMDRAGGPSNLLLEPLVGVPSTRGKDGKILPGIWEAANKAVRIENGQLVLRLKKPYAPLLPVLAGYCPILSRPWTASRGWDGSQATWEKFNGLAKESDYLTEHTNGTGPFTLERWDKAANVVSFARNDKYWRKPANLKRVVLKTLDEFAGRKLQLSAGDADAITVERQYAPQLNDIPGVVVEDDLTLLEVSNVFIPVFDVDVKGNPYAGSGQLDGQGIPANFFADADVRQGFARAFDYDAYIKEGFRGKGKRARGPIPDGVPFRNPDQKLIPFDLKSAEAHFKKAFGGKVWEKGFRLTVTYLIGRADRQLACEILKKNLERINPKFQVDARGLQASTFFASYQQRKLPLINARWGLDIADAHDGVYVFLHSNGDYSRVSGYRNPRADALIEQAVHETDPAKRRALYYELQDIAYKDVPAIFTLDTYNVRARRSWVKNFRYNPLKSLGDVYEAVKQEP